MFNVWLNSTSKLALEQPMTCKNPYTYRDRFGRANADAARSHNGAEGFESAQPPSADAVGRSNDAQARTKQNLRLTLTTPLTLTTTLTVTYSK